MKPQDDISKEQGQKEIVNLQEQFGDGLQDKSLPAAQVLFEQKEDAIQMNALRSTSREAAMLLLPFHPP